MNKSKSEKISIANIISVVGLAALAFLSYLGCSFKWPDQNVGITILLALCPTAVAAFFLWMMTHAKGVENNFRGWMIVEIVSLLAFLGTAVWGGSWMMPFFVVNQRAEELQDAANNDLTAMEQEIDRFVNRQTENLGKMCTGMENVRDDRFHDDQLQELFDNVNFTPESYSLDDWTRSLKNWRELQQKKIDSVEYKGIEYRSGWLEDISEMRSEVNGWKLFVIPDIAEKMIRLAGTAESTAQDQSICGILNSISRNSSLCRIEAVTTDYGRKVYRVAGFDAETYDLKLTFPDELTNGGFSLSGSSVIVLVYILILFNYIFAYRSKKGSLESEANYEHGAAL